MKRLETCPDVEVIERLLHATDAGDEELEQLAEHLDSCETCRKRADAITCNAALEDDLHWATKIRERTAVNVDDSLARLNEILPEYELIDEIGRGGMGIVYRAIQPKLNREVAIKVLPALMGVVRPEAKARFRREAELAAGLDHTNIISIHDYGDADGTLFYAMQLIRGRSLREVLDEIEQAGAGGCVVGDPCGDDGSASTTRSPSGSIGAARVYYRRVAQWIAEVADALQYAHEHGVIHRDIKPSNLLLTADGKLMISDFGLARPNEAATLTRSHALLGTCRYMAPEQLNPEAPAADRRSDIYALGASLYELLAFRPMFSAPDDRQVMHQITSREPVPPHRVVRTVPRELETICLKAVRKDPSERYPSAGALADDLRRWLLDMPIEARRGSVVTRTARLIRRHKSMTALAVLALALTLTSASLWMKYDRASRASARAQLDEASQRARGHVHQAMTHLDDERYDDAIASLDRALEIDPDNADAVHIKGVAYIRTGRNDRARALLSDAAASDADDWRSRYLLGMLPHIEQARWAATLRLADRRGEPGSAVRISASIGAQLAHVERLLPGSPEALTLRSSVEPNHARAIEILDNAIALDPEFTDAIVEKANRLGCMGRFEESLVFLDAALAAHHGGTRVHGMRGMAFYAMNHLAEADAALSSAISCDPTNIDWWYDRAVVRSYSGRLASAVEDATRAIELDPGYAYAFVARGKARGGLGDHAGALADFNQAAELDPTNADIYVERGLIHWLAGRYDQSLADANMLIELDPGVTRGYQRRAQTYLKLERWDDALADLDRCDELNPSDFATPTIRGGVLMNAERYLEAASAFEIGEQRRPAAYGNYHYHAMCMIRAGRPHAAIAPLTSWIALADNADMGRMRRGMVYEISGEPRLALTDYAAAAQGGRLGGYAELWAGIMLALQGDKDDAERWYTMSESASGGSPWILAVLSTIRGESTPDALQTLARTPGQRTEALYYSGIACLLNGDTDTAVQNMGRCAESGSIDTFETDFARLRLTTDRDKKEMTPAGFEPALPG